MGKKYNFCKNLIDLPPYGVPKYVNLTIFCSLQFSETFQLVIEHLEISEIMVFLFHIYLIL